ncbi:MAG: tetratricopeptide repeat protein, partial [Rhodothermales bacterium]
MPITWYAQDGRWDLAPKFDDGNNYRFGRPITQACMTCHNAVPKFVEGSENKFAEVPGGIDCERCHGPGEIHVEEKLAGKVVDVTKEIDYSIVNPAKLPIERQFDVCQRCHMQGATVFKEGKTPFDYRPGMRLADVMNVYWPRYADSTTHFIMAAHPDRLKMSACFQESRESGSALEGMTCTTCHDPHLPIEALGADHYREVCTTCHTPEPSDALLGTPAAARTAAGECTATSALRLSANDDCASCHMPQSGSIDIPHVRVTDHYIRTVKPSAAKATEREPVFLGLASLLDKQPSQKDMADGYMSYFEEISNVPYFLDSADVHLKRALKTEPLEMLAPSLVRLRFLQKDYEEIVRISRSLDRSRIADAWTLYRIGEAYMATNDLQTATRYFESAASKAPYHLRFQNRLGMAYVSSQEFDRATVIFDRLISENPALADAYNNRGFAYAMQGDFASAESDLRKALSLDPDGEQALGNMASLYLNTSSPERARQYARRLLNLHPSNQQYQQLWDLVK